ncbi:MAG TPA: GAF domain-containing protein [Rudaea sp.]|nr:GAF domain-containing protein [Rudaea sp.]
MPARLSVYPPDSPALIRVLEDGVSYRIGRSQECEIRVEHFSVSRFHAELRGAAAVWTVHDTGSKNGLRVGGQRAKQISLNAATWFTAGDVYCWFELTDIATAAAFKAREDLRRSSSRSLSQRLMPSFGIATLIPQTLDLVLELSGLERGFMLYADAGEPLRVRAARGIGADDIASRSFSGSAAAVDRALRERRSVVCCDTGASPWLGVRPSVRLGGIRALVCVPLQVDGGALGVVYADSRKPGPPITELDLELIGNVADQAAAAMAARRLQDDMADVLKSAADAGLAAPLWDTLRGHEE